MKSLNHLILLMSILLATGCSTSEVPLDELPIDPIEPVTYEKDVKNIINSSCATANCHDDISPAVGLALTSYNLVRNAALNGNLFGRINNTASPMPPTGLLPLSTRQLIGRWADDGYLEE